MTGERRVLVAGIGNIFFGDDGFGVEVVRRLAKEALPSGVDIADYGIRGVHLAYDLLENGYGCLILIDAVPMGERPGTLALLEVSKTAPSDGVPGSRERHETGVDAHTMSPDTVIRVLETLGGDVERIFVVGCQPGVIDDGIGLSAPVLACLDDAAQMARDLAAAQAHAPGDIVAHPTISLTVR